MIDTITMYTTFKNKIIGDYIKEVDSLHDQSRILLLFNLTFTVFILALIAALLGLILGSYATLVPALGNVFLTATTLFILHKKKLKLAASFYLICAFFLLFGNLNFNEGTMHIGSPFWIMILNILVMYILGIRWGISFLVASILGFCYYVVFVLPESIKLVLDLPSATYNAVLYETLFALTILGYVIATILRSSKKSDELLLAKNESLLKQNEIISNSNEEKTVLLKEIHHRVKNNLQVIISLIRLKMHELEDENAIQNYKETINRVMTMSMIHEKIYQSDEISRIDIENYFTDLSNELINSLGAFRNVAMRCEVNVEKMDLNKIVPLALIFNELLSNSLKHAFNETDNPEISFALNSTASDEINMVYKDNGKWKVPTKESSFGLDLIDSLVDQLDGKLTLETEDNCIVKISF